jgi:exodeoxyribonuclease-3
MRIATWNVNSVRTRLAQLCAWLEAERPEVVCLQETKVADDLFPGSPLAELGYAAAFSGQKAYNGVAILSTLPLEDVRVGLEALLPGEEDARALDGQKRVISAVVEGVRVLNLYVPNGSAVGSEKYAFKLRWLECLRRYLEAQAKAGDPLCMVGDFNIAPEARDIHDPARFTGGIMASDAERQALREVLGDQLGNGPRLAHRPHLSRCGVARVRHGLCDPSEPAGATAAERPCAGGGAAGLAAGGGRRRAGGVGLRVARLVVHEGALHENAPAGGRGNRHQRRRRDVA